MLSAIVALSLIFAQHANASKQIRAVGSSTVYPFLTVAAEEFGHSSDAKTPIVESTGTGGGFKLFCSGVGDKSADIANASRAIKQSEVELCASNSVNDILEVKIGYDGIVLANSIEGKQLKLTIEEIFNALARDVVKNGKLVKNPYTKWNEINPALPAKKIEVYGPPPTSGTRDAFVELVLEKACKNNTAFKATYPNKKERKKICHLMREDGHFIEAGENDNLIVQKLTNNVDALGIFGYSFLDQNGSSVQGSIINNVEPNFEKIADGSYPVSRPLYVYFKGEHMVKYPALKQFAQELVGENASGEEGYLAEKGLIPLSEEEITATKAEIEKR